MPGASNGLAKRSCRFRRMGDRKDATNSVAPSASRKADCYDNAPMESFFHTLKTEFVHHRQYATRAEAKRDIFSCVEGFNNRTRRHSAIGCISPIEMELKAA